MNALKPRPPFQVLVMPEESRLEREQIDLLRAQADHGRRCARVLLFFYLEDRERTLDSAMDKIVLSLTGFAAEMEREKARQRTYDAMHRKAAARQVAGGVVYGPRQRRRAGRDPRPRWPGDAPARPPPDQRGGRRRSSAASSDSRPTTGASCGRRGSSTPSASPARDARGCPIQPDSGARRAHRRRSA
jgi:hypothetical protein